MANEDSETTSSNKKLLILALVLGVLAFVLNFYYIALQGSKITVYKAKDLIKVGTPADESLFKKITLTGDIREMKSVVIDSESFVAMRGQPLAETLQPGSILLTRSFRLSGEGGIRDRIESSQKAISVRVVDETQAVGYFAQPGDMVDVWGVIGGEGFLTLKNACVQAVGDAYLIPSENGVEGRYRSITVFVPNDETGIKNLLSNLSVSGDEIFLTLTGKCDPQLKTEIPSRYLKLPPIAADKAQPDIEPVNREMADHKNP